MTPTRPDPSLDLRIVPDAAAIAQEAARLVRADAAAAIAGRGVFRIALAGGRTPKGVYEALAAAGETPAIDWSRVELYFGDERHVAPEHPDSNYRMVRESLLNRVPVPPEHVHRIPAEETDAGEVADAYARTLRRGFGLGPGEWPRFDLVLLGMGQDGHTASLFPHTSALDEAERLVVAVWVASLQSSRISLTLPVINHARHVTVLAGGAEKSAALHAALDGPADPDTYPIQRVRPLDGRLTWIVDRAAAHPPGH
jgi:6-phosphogluconolactonase